MSLPPFPLLKLAARAKISQAKYWDTGPLTSLVILLSVMREGGRGGGGGGNDPHMAWGLASI